MEFSSICNNPFTPIVHRLEQEHNRNLCSSATGQSYSAGPSSADEACEKMASFCEGMGRVLIGIPLFFVNSIVAVGGLIYSGASAIVEKSKSAAVTSTYHIHKAGHILTHSEGKVWDEDVWKAKRKTDFVKELLTVSNKDEIGQVEAANELITGRTNHDINNVAAAKELIGVSYLADLIDKDPTNVANDLWDNLAAMPKVTGREAKTLIESAMGTMNRDQLHNWLLTQDQQSPLVKIARAFLAKSNAEAKQRETSTVVKQSSKKDSDKDNVLLVVTSENEEKLSLLEHQDGLSQDGLSQDSLSDDDEPIQLQPQVDNDIPFGIDEARVLSILKKAIESVPIMKLQDKLRTGITLQEVDNAVTVLMYKLASIPEISDEEAKKHIESILGKMSRTELNTWLQTQDQQSPLVKIALAFLTQCTNGDNAKPFSINEAGLLCMLKNAIEAQQTMDLKQKLAAVVANGDLQSSHVDDAVKVLMYELGKMPPAPNVDDTLLTREKLVAQLNSIQTAPPTPLIEITLKFLAESSKGNSTKPLNANEWTIISALTGGIATKLKMEAKQNQRALEEDGKQLQKLKEEYKAFYNKKYEACCNQLIKENRAYKIPRNAHNLKVEAQKRLEADKELIEKFKEIEVASDLLEVDKKNLANIQLQSKLKIAENLESISFFAWNKLSHADAITYLDGETKYEFLPGYNNVNVHGFTAGVDFGLKKLLPGEPNAFAGAKIGITYTDNYFSDDENYLGHVTGQWNLVGTLLARAGWDGMYGTSANANLTRSFRARYAEWGSNHLRNVHQFTDKGANGKGRAKANNVEQYGHHYDSQAKKFKDDPNFKPLLSRRTRLGMDESYLDYEDWDEVTQIDQTKLNFDTTEKKKEGDMQVQNSLALTSTTYTKETLDSYYVEPSQEAKDRIQNDKFHLRESADHQVETSKEGLKPVQKDIHNIRESFRENAKNDISELKRQRDRVIEDVELELHIIKEQCLNDIEAYWQVELRSVKKEKRETVERDRLKQLNAVNDLFSKLEQQLNLIEINKRPLKEQRINRLNEVELALNQLDALVGNNKSSEKIRPLIAEFHFLLAEEVDKENELNPSKPTGHRYEMIGSEDAPWISDFTAKFDIRPIETKNARQHRLNIAIVDKENELRVNELKLELLFKLLPLNSQYAAGKIAQLMHELKLEERDLPLFQNPTNQQDQDAHKLEAIYQFKIDYANNQSKIQKIKLKRDLDIAAVKRDYARKIAQAHEKEPEQKTASIAEKQKLHPTKSHQRHSLNDTADFDVVKMLDPSENPQDDSVDDSSQEQPEKITQKESKLREIEDLEQKRDAEIRKKQKEALLEEADIELNINLAALQVKGDDQNREKEIKFRREHAIKKHRIENQFKLQELKQQNALKLAATERKWTLEYAQLEYKHAAEIRKAEIEIKRATLNAQIAIAKKKPDYIQVETLENNLKLEEKKQNRDEVRIKELKIDIKQAKQKPDYKKVGDLQYELQRVEKEYVRHEVKIEEHILKADPRIIEKAKRFADVSNSKSLLGLDEVVTQAVDNPENETEAKTYAQVREQARLKVAELTNAQNDALIQSEQKRDREFAEFDKKHADDIFEAEYVLKKGELEAEKDSLLLAKNNQKAGEVQARIDALNIQFEIDQLRRQRDYEIETLTDDEIQGMRWDRSESELINKFGPTLGRMKICEAQVKKLETKRQEILSVLEPWADAVAKIQEQISTNEKTLRKIDLEILQLQFENPNLLATKKMGGELDKAEGAYAELKSERAKLVIRKLKMQQLIQLLPLQSQTAEEQRKRLIKDLQCEILFANQQQPTITYSVADEEKAQEIRDTYGRQIVDAERDVQRNLARLDYQQDVQSNATTKNLYERVAKRNELDKELYIALNKINSSVYEAPKSQDKARIDALTQEEKKKKDDEQAWTKEYLSWIPTQNKIPINFTNTDVEHNGAYLADYYTWSVYGSASGDGATSELGGLSGSLELSGKRRYTNLTREKFTFLCDMLGNIYKPPEEKKGIAKLLDEQLNSEPPKTTTEKLSSWWSPEEKPASIKEIIIAGWQENNLFSYQPTTVSKKPTSYTVFDPKTKKLVTKPAYTVDKSYFTVENALRCVNQDMISIIDLQTKAESKDESIRKGTEEALAILQKRYGAHNMHELVRHMAYFIASLRVLSTHGGDYNVMNPIQVAEGVKPTPEMIELQGKIKAAETMLFERVKVEKEEYWRECGVEESQIVSVTLRQGMLKGKVGVKLGPAGSYVTGSFKLEHFKRRHVMETRDSNYFDITGSWGYLAGLAGGIGLMPETLQDTIKDGWNHVFSDGDLSQNGSAPDFNNSQTIEESKTARYHWMRRFEPLYKELGYTMEWLPTYVRPVITKEKKVGFEASAPLDKIFGVPVHPNIGFSTSTFETESVGEKWRGKSHQHPLMHYMHANHTNDIDRNTGKVLKKGCFWDTSRTAQRAFFAEMSESHGSQQWQSTHKKTPTLNELHVREVEFKRNSLLDPSLFRAFQRAKAHYLRVTKYYDVLHHSQKRIAERNAEIAKLQAKIGILDKELTDSTNEQMQRIAELHDKNEELKGLPQDSAQRPALELKIKELEKNVEEGKKFLTQLDNRISVREQKIEALKKKIERISTTVTEAQMYFKEKNTDPKCTMKEFAHNHCVESLEALYHAYFPQDYSLLLNSPLYSASTIDVNGTREATYNKRVVMKAAMSGKKGTVPTQKFVRDDAGYWNDSDSYFANLHEQYYTNYAFK